MLASSSPCRRRPLVVVPDKSGQEIVIHSPFPHETGGGGGGSGGGGRSGGGGGGRGRESALCAVGPGFEPRQVPPHQGGLVGQSQEGVPSAVVPVGVGVVGLGDFGGGGVGQSPSAEGGEGAEVAAAGVEEEEDMEWEEKRAKEAVVGICTLFDNKLA